MKRFLAILLTLSMLPFAYVGANADVWGDADGDGSLTANDVAVTLQNVLTNGSYIAAADVDGNSIIDSTDAAIILQKLLDSNYIMPVEKDLTTESTTEATTETTTETTTEATETTTEVFPADGVIRTDYELTPAKLKGNGYFAQTGDADFTASNDTRIRMRSKNSLTFKVAEGANVYVTAKHASSTDGAPRSLTLSSSTGTDIGSYDYEMVTDAEAPIPEILFAANLAAGTYVLQASKDINIYSVRVTFGKVDVVETTTENTTEETTEYEVPSEITTTGNAVYVSNFEELKAAVAVKNSDVYVQNDIDCPESLNLNQKNANVNIIGVTQADGTSPSLDFATYRDSITKVGESGTGVRVSGTYYNLENLIVENAPNCGMRIKGSGTGHCIIKDCIFRYNNNSGVSVTEGGGYNTFIGVDSYRNCDLIKSADQAGSDADGFSIKIHAGEKNYFYNCRSWDNSDDGWDSFDYSADTGSFVGDISYIECLAWHNGKAETFTGEYDYEMGNPLDKNLLYVQQILKEQPDFETAYNNKTITEWPQVTITLYGNMTRSYAELHSSVWEGNPNGFKFGSAYTPDTSYRYIENCIAFDHDSKGYDQNNAKAQFDIVNGLSFDNNRNYQMGNMTCLSAIGTIIGFNGVSTNNLPDGMTITEPSAEEQAGISSTVYAYRDDIRNSVFADIIPGIKLCDVF